MLLKWLLLSHPYVNNLNLFDSGTTVTWNLIKLIMILEDKDNPTGMFSKAGRLSIEMFTLL